MNLKRKSLLKYIILLLILLIPFGISSWIYFNNTSTIKAKNENEYIVSVYGIRLSRKITESTRVRDSEILEDPSIKETATSPTYKEGDYYGDVDLVSSTTSYSADRLIETNITKYKQKRIEKCIKGSGFIRYNYTYKYAWYSWTITITKSRSAPADSLIATLKVKPNSYIKPFDFSINNYNQYAFYDSDNFDTLFDFSKPITGNVKIYIKY